MSERTISERINNTFGLWLERLGLWLLGVFLVDRLLKLWALVHFFRRPAPTKASADWPSVTVLSPITHGVSNLPNALACRAALDYPAPIQHLLICDEGEQALVALCRRWQQAHPKLNSTLFLVTSPDQPIAAKPIATKIEKLNAALPHATGDVLLFVDDDVALRPATLTTLLPYLDADRAGAIFGLACYRSWHNLPTSLMSAFVNSNALWSYVPLTYLTEPFTITGHCFALRRSTFWAAGGLAGMGKSVGDDHELARRLRRIGLRSIQTPLIYDVENHFATLRGYGQQMRRWFVFPQWMLTPYLTPREQFAMTAGGLAGAVPPLLLLLALLARRAKIWWALALLVAFCNGLQFFCERRYLGRPTPWYRWPLYTVSALIAPLQIIAALLDHEEVQWRGQRLRLGENGQIIFLREE